MAPRKTKKKAARRSTPPHGKPVTLKPSGPSQRSIPTIEVDLGELRSILSRAQGSSLSTEDYEKLNAAIDTLAFITQQLEEKGVTIARLRKLIFGPSSEKTRDVLKQAPGSSTEPHAEAPGEPETGDGEPGDIAIDGEAASAETGEGDSTVAGDATGEEPADRTKRKGHGRNGAADYPGAERVTVAHDSVEHRMRCPECTKGKVYRLAEPAVLVRVRGVAPLSATVYELERLRCNLCGQVFTASPPPGVGDAKYDETAAAMIALLKYGTGVPFNRMERLGANLKIPLPASTQWEVVAPAAELCEPVWAELIRQAADGEVVYIDDTKARVLDLSEQLRADLARGDTERTGIFTSGVVSTVGDRRLAVFFTGNEHAGENLRKVLAERRSEAVPIVMSDALSRNTPGDFVTIVAHCLVHARRNFVDVVASFPAEVAHVLEALGEVYRNEAHANEEGLTPEERLLFHQEASGPVMEDLKGWLEAQIEERRVEPNSSLGKAIHYMLKRWETLTRFLHVPGAPLDNNLCERALKKAILHRKNSLFYKTENGAHVGDVFLSLIHTTELCDANPFDYLVAVQRHANAARVSPQDWLPWNYTDALAKAAPDDDAPT